MEENSQLLHSEFSMVTQILQKFAFANEDIMRRYIHSQFANHIDKEISNIYLNQIVQQTIRVGKSNLANGQNTNKH